MIIFRENKKKKKKKKNLIKDRLLLIKFSRLEFKALHNLLSSHGKKWGSICGIISDLRRCAF